MFPYKTKPKYELELISRPPQQPDQGVPLLFVHGAYAAAWVWEEYFMPFFSAHGYQCHALSLRGHGGSEGHEYLALTSLDDYVADLEQVIGDMPQHPVLIGHSMGGMVVQQYLQKHQAPGAALLASVPPEGLLNSALQLAFREPQVFLELNLVHSTDGRHATIDSIGRALFSENLPRAEMMKFLTRFQPESHRAILDMSFLPFRFQSKAKPTPMLVLGAEKDSFFPPYMVHSTAARFGTRAEIFEGMAHTMMLEPGWREVAERILVWLSTIPR